MHEKDYPERKRLRLYEYDYSRDGLYFITIRTQFGKEVFGEVRSGKMVLNQYGEIVAQQWRWLAEQYPYVFLDEFIVMPNHMHGILGIDRGRLADTCRCVGRGRCTGRGRSRPTPTSAYETMRPGHRSRPTTTHTQNIVYSDHESRPVAHKIKIKPISELIGAFKTTSSKMIHQAGLPEFAWQRSFYDHVIRDDEERWYIQKYIRDNPKSWEKDRNNPKLLRPGQQPN